MENLKEVMLAKATLYENGYFSANLWHIDNVQLNYDCDAETAQTILYKALTNEATMEQIRLAIKTVAEDEFNLKAENEEEESYNIFYYRNGELIDETQVDELNEELVWSLFKEFGHERQEGDTYEFTKQIDN